MAYEISGPVNLGSLGQQSNIIGNVSLSNVTTTLGDLVYADGTPANNLTRLGIGAPNTVLTSVLGVPTWAAPTGGNIGKGFMMKKSGTQLIAVSPTVITGWTITPGIGARDVYDTSGSLGTLSAGGGTFQVTVPGKYQIILKVNYTNTSNSGSRSLQVFDGTNIIASTMVQPTGSVVIPNDDAITINVDLTAGVIISPRISYTGVTSITIQPGDVTWFGMVFLG